MRQVALIAVVALAACATPAATAPSPTPSEVAAATVAPTASPTAIATPLPTSSPTPAPNPTTEPSPTPEPSPTASPTPVATPTAAATSTQAAAAASPAPTVTAVRTPAPTRAATPVPTTRPPARPAGGILVSGTVTRADTGAPVSRVQVTGIANGHIAVGTAFTDSSGRYTLAVRPSYADAYYQVSFSPPDGSGLARQYWPASYTPAGATKFDLSKDLSGADGSLVRGYTVSGSVKKKSPGWGEPYLWVALHDFRTANPDWSEFEPSNAGVRGLAEPGPFQITGVAAGSYYLGFSLNGQWGLEHYHWWRDGSFATAIKVVVNGDVSGLDIELP